MREQVQEVFNRLADEDPGPPGRRQTMGRRRWVSPQLVLATLCLVVLAAPLAVGATGDTLREAVRNGTTTKETEIIGKFNAGTGAKGGYVTRQSNTQTGSNAGGGAIYGCRGAAGGTAGGSAPCLRASNLADGLAFEFASKSGPAGVFGVGSASEPPFATNGGGLVTNLNADRVDNLHASEIVALARTKAGLDADALDGKDSTAFVQSADVGGLIPVAVVNIAADGTLRASSHRAPVTGTPIVTHVGGSPFYDVDLPGVKFFFSDDAANCSIADGASKIASVNSISGDDLRVRVTTNAGADTEGALYCAIYNLK
jgi:hypothetical protein